MIINAFVDDDAHILWTVSIGINVSLQLLTDLNLVISVELVVDHCCKNSYTLLTRELHLMNPGGCGPWVGVWSRDWRSPPIFKNFVEFYQQKLFQNSFGKWQLKDWLALSLNYSWFLLIHRIGYLVRLRFYFLVYRFGNFHTILHFVTR